MENIKLERWEGDEFIITINDKPVGSTVNARTGEVILNWLKHAMKEILNGKEEY